jgi:hypothetical protein
MEKITLDVGESPLIRFLSIGGDLRLSGRSGGQLEAKSSADSNLRVEKKDGAYEIICKLNCLIFLPRGAQVEGKTIGGDVRVTSVNGELQFESIGGDLNLRQVGPTNVEAVGGDLMARRVEGALNVDQVGADVVGERISGSVTLSRVGGDVRLDRVDGNIDLSAGGDSRMSFQIWNDADINAQVGGDMSVRLPKDLSAMITLQAGGEIISKLPAGTEVEREGNRIKVGEGSSNVNLKAGGDLLLRGGFDSETINMDPDQFADVEIALEESMRDLEANMMEMEAKLGAFGADLGRFGSDRIAEQVKRSVARARRKAEKAKSQANWQKDHNPRIKIDFGGPKKPKQEVDDEERLSILRMVENETITVDQAEQLLQALEGEL